jgi:beta-glucosidase
MYLVDYYHPKLTEDLYWAEVEGYYTPDEDGDYEFGLTVHGTGKLYLDDEILVDNETDQRSGGSFFNVGTVEEVGVKTLKAGITYKLKVEYASGATSKLTDADGVVSFGGGGIRIGGARVIDSKEEIRKAVELAKSVDQVILCVGLNVSRVDFIEFRVYTFMLTAIIARLGTRRTRSRAYGPPWSYRQIDLRCCRCKS